MLSAQAITAYLFLIGMPLSCPVSISLQNKSDKWVIGLFMKRISTETLNVHF